MILNTNRHWSNLSFWGQKQIAGKILLCKGLGRLWQLILGVASLSLLLSPVRPGFGAERIYLSYGILERSISISSIDAFASTGKVNDELALYASHVSPEQLAQFRRILQTQIPLDVVTVSQFLYTPTGERLLDRLSQVIQTDARQPGFYGLRAALILAAADPTGFTPLKALHQFPTRGIRIDIGQSLAVVDNLQVLVRQTNQAVSGSAI